MPGNDDQCAFTALFVREFERGAGNPQAKPGKSVPWTVPLFRQALGRKLQEATTLTVSDVSDDAIRTWLSGKSVPRFPMMQLIAEVFYPDDEAARDAMAEAWRASQGPKARRAPALVDPPRQASWAKEGTPAISGVIELTIRDPELENDPDRPGWRITGRLLAGEDIVETTALNSRTQELEPVYIRLGLKPGLLLAVEGEGGVTFETPSPGDDAAHIKLGPGGWKITGPVHGKSGLLDGTAFDGITLAHVRDWPEGSGASLTFSITASGPRLSVVEVDEEGEPMPEPNHTKAILLDLVLREALGDDRTQLQRVTLTRVPPE